MQGSGYGAWTAELLSGFLEKDSLDVDVER